MASNSDSDDDWFNKDVDEFVAPVPARVQTPEKVQIPENIVSPAIHKTLEEIKQEYGGSCSNQKVETGFVKKLSQAKLIKWSKLEPIETFCKIYTYQDKFLETLASENNEPKVVCLELLIKLFKVPTTELFNSLLQQVVKQDCFINKSLLRKVKTELKTSSNETMNLILTVCTFISENLKEDKNVLLSFIEEISTLILKNNPTGELNELKTEFDKMKKIITERKDEIDWFLPKLDDFLETNCVLEEMSPNLIKGKYESVNKYLDTHKNFLREEFMGPLRIVVNDFKRKPEQENERFKIYRSRTSKNTFLIENFTPKKLIHGDLLLLTSSKEVKDLILAVVDSLKGTDLEVEIISIQNLSEEGLDKEYFVLENGVFFEPFFHVYKSLNQLIENNFPFKNIILDLDKEEQTEKMKSFNISASSLDPSQLEALKSGLCQKLTLIQGPPGTGKTLIGLKLIETFLKLNKNEKILIVCSTNHSVDELLKGVSKFNQEIVRFGNQSKNEELDRYNVKELAKENECYSRDMYLTVKSCYSKNTKTLEFSEEFVKERVKYLNEMEEVKQLQYFYKIKSKRVVGMTTTAAARLRTVLQLYQPRVVIFEESGEILESHLLASLTESLEQVILIGDHHQLRPTLNVYDLSEKYKMDISLFERLIMNQMDYISLNCQSRMRPEFSDLIRGTFYDKYDDNSNVLKLPDFIRGFERNLFFLDHRIQEEKEGQSKSNLFESRIALNLADYLLKHGYRPDDIAILTTYNGQTERILLDKAADFPQLDKIKVKTVDNFQGEESQIVILSLVRSNQDRNIGYLSTKNRICVALSRARIGLFMIGNMNLLSKTSSVWAEICHKFWNKNSISEEIPLKCENHQNVFSLSTSIDFDLKLNRFGGCTLNDCTTKCPNCATICTLPCHPTNVKHNCFCE